MQEESVHRTLPKQRPGSAGTDKSVRDVFYRDPNRSIQRQRVLDYIQVGGGFDPGSLSGCRKASSGEYSQRKTLFELANKSQSERTFEFSRFERLSLLNIYHLQHKLTLLDEEIEYDLEGVLSTDKEKELHESMQAYVDAIEIFQRLSTLKQPGLDASRNAGRFLALKLKEPHYWDSPDALNLCDLTPSRTLHTVDSLRLLLQKVMPKRFLDDLGRERRQLDDIARRAPKNTNDVEKENWFRRFRDLVELPRKFRDLDAASPGRGTLHIIESYRARPYHISPVVDSTVRLIVAIGGGLLVLVPMVVLSYVTAFKWILVITFLFTIFFSIGLSIVSRASNDQIMTATAAYGAVLVVFIANILPKTTPP